MASGSEAQWDAYGREPAYRGYDDRAPETVAAAYQAYGDMSARGGGGHEEPHPSAAAAAYGYAPRAGAAVADAASAYGSYRARAGAERERDRSYHPYRQ